MSESLILEENKIDTPLVIQELFNQFGEAAFYVQDTHDAIPTLWVTRKLAPSVILFVKQTIEQPYRLLFDLTAVDERVRIHREGLPTSSFTVIYHLLSIDRNSDLRIKVALKNEDLTLPSISDFWPMANWYEREVWDMFGITFTGHPNLRRILMPIQG